MKIYLLIALFIFPVLSHAALYKWTNSDGEVIYSDTPPNDELEEMKLPILTTTPSVKYKAKEKSEPEKEDKAGNYTEFTLIEPVNEASFTDNTGNVAVSLGLKPGLDTSSGHSISIFVDGQASISNSQQTSVQLVNLDRGTHSIHAEIRDKKGAVLMTSNTVSITIIRYSKLHKRNLPPPPPPPPSN